MTEPRPRAGASERSRPVAPRGLFSVAQIQHILRVEFARAQRYRYPLSCLMIAVDQLESLRDLGGYEIKEQVLESVVGMLQSATRTSDFLGRTADDRLAVVIPHTPREGARALAERLRARARDLRLPSAAGERRLTLSIGLAWLAGEGMLYSDALLSLAETAQGEASAQGGDRSIERALGGPES
jgi:diguanylate cyclase (GGDEF)-like protein